jgi:hypothetical protein
LFDIVLNYERKDEVKLIQILLMTYLNKVY